MNQGAPYYVLMLSKILIPILSLYASLKWTITFLS